MRIPPIGRALVALLALSACKPRETAPAAPGGRVLRISQRNEPDSLDPALADLPDDFFVIRALSEGLVTPAFAGGAPAPAASDRWQASPNGRVWTFHLAPQARWSNGEPVTAADFIASYRRALDPATAAPHADLFFPVANARAYAAGQLADFSEVGFRAPRPDELVVTLERPTPEFLEYAASGAWIPVNPRVVAQFGRRWTDPKNYVGNGPFVLTEWRPNQRITVQRNPLYSRATDIRLDQIQFVRFDDGETEERAYRAGEVDVTMAIPVAKLAAYARERPAELHHAPLAQTRYLAFNTRRRPLADVRVRRALTLAIDRGQLIADVLRGGQQLADRLVPPELRPAEAVALSPESGGGPVPPSPPAVGEARRLLAAAGYPEGSHWPGLELAGWSSNPILEAIQAMWKKKLGIGVTLVNRDAVSHMAAVRSGRYDIAFLPTEAEVPDAADLLNGLTTGAAGNYSGWSDPAFDLAADAVARAPSAAQRVEPWRAAEALLADQCPVAPLYYNARNWAMRPFVHGWRENSLWARSYSGLWLDPVPPGR